MEFTINGSALDGKDIVVFETLYKGERKVAVHADINDENQTIHFPEVKTKASDNRDGDKLVDCEKEVTVKDIVEYEGLIVGKEYTVKGVLMDKESGKALEINGKPITGETTFTAEKESGSVEVLFTFDASSIEGKKLVVFEKLFYAGSDIEVANHEDIEDEGQTVQVDKKLEKEVPPTTDIPKTGDNSNVWIWIVLLVLAGSGITAARVVQRKKEVTKKKEEQ